MTPIEAARDWLARGFLPVPVPFREKGPVEDGWQKMRLSFNDLPRYFNSQPQNIGILLGDDSGTADIDCDGMEAVAAAVEFVTPTGICFGRKSKPASHYIYRSIPRTRSRKSLIQPIKALSSSYAAKRRMGLLAYRRWYPPG